MADIDGTPDGEFIEGTNDADTIDAMGGDDRIDGLDGDDFLDGGPGFDVGDWRSRGESFTFTLTGFTNTAVGDVSGETDTFERLESIFGTDFGDTINVNSGFSGDDGIFVQLRLGAGNDVITNDGADARIEYLRANAGVTVDLGAGTGQSTAAGDVAGVGLDTFTGVNRVRGSNFDDILLGSNSGSTFQQFEGRAGNDFIDGVGGDNNEVRYSFAPSSIFADLRSGQIVDGYGTIDTVVNIQDVRGSDFADFMIAGDSRAEFRGEDGDDYLVGGEGGDFFQPGRGNDTIIGGGGFDVADYGFENGGQSVTFNLSATTTASGAGTGTDTFTGVEIYRGSNAADVFMADDSFRADEATLLGRSIRLNLFRGDGGDDIIQGNGATLLVYDNATASIDADFIRGTVIGSDASVGTDTISGVFGIEATDFDDVLRGSDSIPINVRFSSEFFRPGAGNDLIDGRGGFDRVDYRFENNGMPVVADLSTGTITDGFGDTDTLISIEGVSGSDFNDQLTGDAFDNLFETRGGDDIVDGSGGFDFVDYDGLLDSVVVDLAMQTATKTNVGTDTLISIEHVRGSAGNDSIGGSAASNILLGYFGDDMLFGLGEDDTLDGGAGSDVLNGGAGTDTADYDFDEAGVAASLVVGRAVDGSGGVDTFVSIENLMGSKFADILAGDENANEITGGLGRDVMVGGGGGDSFILRDTAESPLNGQTRDIIQYFAPDDMIDLSQLDADLTTAGHQGFNFLGRVSPNNLVAAGDVKYYQTGGRTFVVGGNDADAVADFQIEITGFATLTTDNFAGLDMATLTGTAGADTLQGTAGDDILTGLGGRDILLGEAGSDRYVYNDASDSPLSGSGRDKLMSFDLSDVIDLSGIDADLGTAGHQGFIFTGQSAPNNLVDAGEVRFFQAGARTFVVGGNDADAAADFQIEITGAHALTSDNFMGLSQAILEGGAGQDTLIGSPGDDILTGNGQRDTLIGRAGADMFVYNLVSDSPLSGSRRDVIQDFEVGTDMIDLSGIDADLSVGGDQAFNFLGQVAPNNVIAAGDVHFYQTGGRTFLVGGNDADALADFQIEITGMHALTAGDLVL